ncbi:hypothetical protein RZQ51_09585 [Klebsiella quasipneumoniae subsp. similipneumoniae]|nr:hypothetical protein [Klebsiella quasipneumoniae]MDV1351729.1 hypothetical protein [Klebsiella quasipneumoniae subsp. similipneumoniae]MDV1366428.1 hypothetical protein [Klebsiella quasipneumoniae subsp. similipneumoniae]
MPPVQPVADSEPDRNPVLAYADSYRDMAKQGVESVPIWSVITDLERNIAPLYRHAQQPVVPDEKDKTVDADDHPLLWSFNEGWNACRAAMLQASNSPAQSDCCPAQNHVSPEQNSVSPAQSPIDHGYRPECECSGCKATARICAELSANSTANPDCWCRTCRPVTLNDMRFVVCPDCGNKRCPRANDHRNACTGSNEPGQEGSAYPAALQEVKQ